MTSLEALEAYSAHHSESIEELLEWPYRRFMKAFDAWQRRNSIDEIENRKNLHVAALHSNTNWDDEKNDREKQIENIEEYYETLKDIIWDPEKVEKENKQMQEMENADPFLAAGRKNRQKILPPELPNEDEFSDLLE